MVGHKSIWYINKYASPPGANGGLRGLSLSSEFIKLGHEAVVITSRANHYVIEETPVRGKKRGGFIQQEFWGVPTFTHQTLRYTKTASLRRILSWLHFELGILALRDGTLPRPTHIIVSSLSLLTILNGYRLAKKYGARLIFEIRDIWPLTLVAGSTLTKSNPFVKALEWIEKFGYSKADVVVGTMPNLSEHVHSRVDSKCTVKTVGLGVDPELAGAIDTLEPTLARNRFHLVYSGSIGRANALDCLLEVGRSFVDADEVTIDLYGRGDFLQEFSDAHADFPNIIFHGAIPRTELFSHIKSADAVFFAAEDSEIWRFGQSLHKVVEYMALGRPIIGAYSGFPSMINEAKCGVFVPANDPARLRQEILKMKNLTAVQRDELGGRGRQWILKNRSYRKLAEDYLLIMDKL